MSELFPIRTIALEVFRCKSDSQMCKMNRWYDKELVPTLRKIRGVTGVYRYIARDFDYGEYTPGLFKTYMDQPVRFLTVYRIHGEDPQTTASQIREAQRGVLIDCVEPLEFTLWDFCCCRQRVQPLLKQPPTRLPDGMPEMFLLIPNINYEKDLPELDDWWLYTHAHDIMEIPGYTQASRYHNITPSVTDGDPRALNIYEIDSDDPLHHPVLENIIGDEGRMKEGRLLDVKNPQPKGTYLCGTFQHWDIMSGI